MSAAEKISDASEIDEALALAAAETQGGVPGNNNVEIIAGGISDELMNALKKRVAQKVAQKIREVSEQAGIIAGLTEEALLNDQEENLAEALTAEESPSLNTAQPQGTTDQETSETGENEETLQTDESTPERDTKKPKDTETSNNSNTPSPSAPQNALDNFGEDSDNEMDEEDADEEDMGTDLAGNDDPSTPPMNKGNTSAPKKTPQKSKSGQNNTSDQEEPSEETDDDDYQSYLDEMKNINKQVDKDGNPVHTDKPLSEEEWEEGKNTLPEKEAELNKPKLEVPPPSNEEKKAYDQFDAVNAENAERNPNNVPGGAHQDQTDTTGAAENGEASEAQNPQTNGNEYAKPGSAPAEKNRLTQMINKSRFDKELQEIDKKIKQLQMEIDYHDMPPIRKLTKEISGVKKKIRNLNRKIVLYSVLGALCFLFSAILAITIIGILLAGPVMYQGISMFVRVGVLSAEKELLKKQIKDKETSIKMQMKNVKMKQKKIGQLAIMRSKIVNQNLMSRTPQKT